MPKKQSNKSDAAPADSEDDGGIGKMSLRQLQVRNRFLMMDALRRHLNMISELPEPIAEIIKVNLKFIRDSFAVEVDLAEAMVSVHHEHLFQLAEDLGIRAVDQLGCEGLGEEDFTRASTILEDVSRTMTHTGHVLPGLEAIQYSYNLFTTTIDLLEDEGFSFPAREDAVRMAWDRLREDRETEPVNIIEELVKLDETRRAAKDAEAEAEAMKPPTVH
jgi:hypothetical protein